jgi:hypothetical protein
MNQLDDQTRRALCAADQPPPGVEDRIFSAIMGGAGGPGDGGGSGAGLGQSTIVYAIKVVGATLGLAAGGIGLLAVTAGVVRERNAEPRDPSVQIEAAAEPELSAVAAADHQPEPALEPEQDTSPEPASPAVSRPRPARATPATASDSTLEAELALMQVARASADPKQALATLEQHRKQFAAGVFAAEREVLRVEQLCALGRVGEARAIAAAFLAKHPDNPLRSRVDPACR